MPQEEPNSSENLAINPKIVLIGEDDIDDQELLKEIFSSIDGSYMLIFALNGTQVMSYLTNNPDQLPCLIILDYNMPELNGAEILKELKEISRYNSIPKIIWSTSKSTSYKDICLAMGANDYLVKPSNVTDLNQICRYMLSICHS